MADGDLLLSALAAGLLKSQSTQTQTGTPPPSGGGVSVAQFSPEQIAQLANAIRSEIAQIPAPQIILPEIPAPTVNFPPDLAIQFPPKLSVQFSDEELQRIASALSLKTDPNRIKSQIFQRSILIDIGISTIPNSTFIDAEFPAGVKVASFNFAEQAGLIGVTLSASIVNTFTKPCGFFVALASANRLNFDSTPYTSTAEVGNAKTPDAQILLSVFTHQNSTATTINPNTRASAISFGLENAVSIVNSQTTLSLYAFQTIDPATGQGQGGQLMSGILTAYYIPMV
jgi:hypothetical protein